jgi:hypothetical protein
MLRFQTPPDEIFMAILEESIMLMIDQIRVMKSFSRNKEDEKAHCKNLLPFAGMVFNSETALRTLKSMLTYHRKPEVFVLNDYHYLLLYDTLQYYCDVHNDMMKNIPDRKEKKKASLAGTFYIEEILFDDLIDIYFYDTDFLFNADTVVNLGFDNRKALGLNDETFGISQGLAPHPEELKIRKHKYEEPDLVTQTVFWRLGSRVYPDMDLKEE